MNDNENNIIECPKCGAKLSSKATFCGMCGYNFASNNSNVERNNFPIDNQVSNINTQNNSNSCYTNVGSDLFNVIKGSFLSRIIGKITFFIILLVLVAIIAALNGRVNIDAWIVLIIVIVFLSIVSFVLIKLKNRTFRNSKGAFIFGVVITIIVLIAFFLLR